MIQLILHLVGDYILQSDWMANNKTKCSKAAAAHAITYSLPFLILSPSLTAFTVILVTHFFIDRYRLARFVVWGKNKLFYFGEKTQPSPDIGGAYGAVRPTDEWKNLSWNNCKQTGYPSQSPAWLSVWLLIAADNTLHLAINYLALTYL